jgi:dTDP-4-amino-4,6-dideoxygalactose transaminase
MSEMRNPSDAKWYNEQVMLGYNYRMTDFQAALLSSQLNRLDEFKARRQDIVERWSLL